MGYTRNTIMTKLEIIACMITELAQYNINYSYYRSNAYAGQKSSCIEVIYTPFCDTVDLYTKSNALQYYVVTCSHTQGTKTLHLGYKDLLYA